MAEIFGDFGAGLVVMVVLGLVELAKGLGLQGKQLTLLAMAIGCVVGTLFEVSAQFPAALPWVRAGVYGLLLGLTASGLYDLAKRLRG